MPTKKIVIVGGGAAGMMVAERLSACYDIHLYEQGKTLGRKFLVAGKGGFNLSNQATGTKLTQHYSPLPALQQALHQFDSPSMRHWLQDLGIETYIGSSGRVFPIQGTKPIQVLQALRNRLIAKGVQVHYQQTWKGFDEQQRLYMYDKEGKKTCIEADYYIFALGGASWSVTGSNQAWLKYFEEIGVCTQAFEASNCGLEIPWPAAFANRFAGHPLKNIAVQTGTTHLKGEALITQYGLEGNIIYPLVAALRSALKSQGKATFRLNLKPHSTLENLQKKAEHLSPKNYAHGFTLHKAALALAKLYTDKNTYLQSSDFATALQHLTITATGLRPIEEAISTIGGIASTAVNSHFALHKNPSIFIIGEMLDWDAPTGGFLLQGCFSTASACAHYLNSN